MRHLHDNLSVIGAAADDFFFAGRLFQGSIWAGHVSRLQRLPEGSISSMIFPKSLGVVY